MDKVAVIILNWNGRETLRTFLPSVVRHSQMKGTTLYVADNGSTDGSVKLLQKEFPSVRLLLFKENLGFAEGYNQAIQQVEAIYTVLLNSDVEVTEGWLSPLVNYMDTHPEAAACQPKVLSWKQRKQFEYAGAAGGFIDRYGYPFCRGRLLNTIEEDNGQYDTPCSLFWATGAALCIRTACYRQAGGLDGRFFAHMEEIDLCWRLRARGYLLACIPQSVVYHVGGATLSKENPQKTFLNFRNNLLMLYKNLPAAELRSVMRARSLFDRAAAAHYLLKGQSANAKAVLRARRAYRKLRPSFTAAREENLQKATGQTIPERIPFCLLWTYYFHGKHRFTQLDILIDTKTEAEKERQRQK
ncbi:MAG: glycosyltransferase family 2 protein [Prevotellaceae bacterium]|nr:glycosyltransferase family 2 protein [Prevotellaceae bacterium]